MSGSSDEHRQFVFDFRTRWEPVLGTTRGRAFDPKLLSQKDQEDIRQLRFSAEYLPSVLAWTIAMLDWGTVTPAGLRCPALWLIGSENDRALEGLKEYDQELPRSKVQVRIMEGLNHEQEFKNIEQVLPVILEFIRS